MSHGCTCSTLLYCMTCVIQKTTQHDANPEMLLDNTAIARNQQLAGNEVPCYFIVSIIVSSLSFLLEGKKCMCIHFITTTKKQQTPS